MSGFDDFSFSDDVPVGDKLLREEQNRQLDFLFETRCTEAVLKALKLPVSPGYRFSRLRYSDDRLRLEYLQELGLGLPVMTAYRFNNKAKRITTLSYDKLESSSLGEAVKLFKADEEGYWLLTDITLIPGLVAVGKRSFPLEIGFSGYVACEEDGDQCFLICPLTFFVSTNYCKSFAQRSRE